MDRPLRTNYSQKIPSPVFQERSSACDASSCGRRRLKVSQDNYSQQIPSPVCQERPSACVALSCGRGKLIVSQDNYAGKKEPPLFLGSPTQPRYVRPSLLCLASSASSPQRLDSPSMMNSRTGSSNNHNSSCERTLTSLFSSRSHSPSQESVIQTSVVNNNQSFLKDANTITPRDAKSSRSSMPTRVPSLEKVDEGSQNALTSTHRSQPPVQSSPAIVISAKQHSFFKDLHRMFTHNIVKPDIKKAPSATNNVSEFIPKIQSLPTV